MFFAIFYKILCLGSECPQNNFRFYGGIFRFFFFKNVDYFCGNILKKVELDNPLFELIVTYHEGFGKRNLPRKIFIISNQNWKLLH